MLCHVLPAHTAMLPTVAQLSHAVSQVDPAHTVKIPTVAQFGHAVCHVVPLTPSCTIIVVRGKTSSNCHAPYRGTV